MYQKQAPLFERGYMMKENENEAENENRSYRYDINSRRPRHGHEYTQY